MNHQTATAFLRAVAICLMLPAALYAVEIEPPKVQLDFKFGVNMANGQVTHSMEIVSIGGSMGLSDTISVYGNEFDFKGYRGFNHKYYGRALDVQLVNSATPTLSPRTIMRVFGPTGSADFGYYVGGVLQDYGDSTTGSYLPLGDERQTLEVVGNNLEWTTPDGTLLKFDRSIPQMNPKPLKMGGALTSIEYPNGFTITVVSAAMSVNTNTGFQLKRTYEQDTINCGYSPTVRTSAESGWSTHNPKNVIGINAAYEYCAPTATACSLAKNWPTATFEWAHCMPDVLYRADSQIGVKTSQGITTTYKFHPYDLAYEKEQGGIVASGYFVGQQFSPRLASISVPNNSAVPMLEYWYNNLFTTFGNSEGWVDYRLQDSGVTSGARRGTVGASYDIMRPFYNDAENVGGPYSGISFVRLLSMVPGTNSAVDYADTEDGRISFEHSPRNFPTGYLKHSTPNESYGYTRGNLTSVDYSTNASAGYSVAAEYPAACTPTTRRTCNQATRMRDAKGNWTDYTYYADSGQVKTITYPPDKRGVRPQKRYSYDHLSATYYNLVGVLTQGSPIWMKSAEEYCINSAASDGNCAGNDEVVTTYQYESKNLLLKGVTVTAPDGVRRTCYSYDIYGNQIGVTTPNANMGECP